MAHAKKARVLGALVPEQAAQHAPARGFWCIESALTDGRDDGKAHLREQLAQQARADDLGRSCTPEVERRSPEAPGNQRERQEIASEIHEIAQVVAPAHGRDRLIQDHLEIVWTQTVGPTNAEVEIDVLGERRDDHPLHQRLDNQVRGIAAEALERALALLSAAAQEFVADVEGGVRPGALAEILDGRRDPLVALDEDNVALSHVAQERRRIIPATALIGRERLAERLDEAIYEPAAHPQHLPPGLLAWRVRTPGFPLAAASNPCVFTPRGCSSRIGPCPTPGALLRLGSPLSSSGPGSGRSSSLDRWWPPQPLRWRRPPRWPGISWGACWRSSTGQALPQVSPSPEFPAGLAGGFGRSPCLSS